MTPQISIIIPVYNHAYTLERCFAALACQNVSKEVVVVNDGSTDGFGGVMERIRVAYPDLSIKMVQQNNQGAGVARNRGLREAQGDYVIFWDADTVAEPTMLAMLVTALETHPEASYAYCQYLFGWKLMKSQAFDGEALKKYNYIDTTTLIRRTAVVPFDETLHRFQDWDVWLTMLEQGKTGVFVPEVLFSKIVDHRPGTSNWLSRSAWLPSFVYKLPWKIKRVRDYDAARAIVLAKHHLPIQK